MKLSLWSIGAVGSPGFFEVEGKEDWNKGISTEAVQKKSTLRTGIKKPKPRKNKTMTNPQAFSMWY